MKKIYLLLAAAALSMSSQAREFTFYLGDKVIANNETVNFTDLQVVDYGDYTEVTMKPDLYVMSDVFTNTVNITADCTSGQEIMLCAGGSCQQGTTVTKKGVTLQTNKKLPLEFDYYCELDPGQEVPTVTTVIEAVDTEFPETKKSFTIVMSNNSGSITVIENAKELRFTEAGLEYNLSAPATLNLYNVDGQLVKSAALSGAGTLAVDVAAGIYVYTLGDKSGKIYIK